MVIIALVLALVGKPTTTWTWLNMLLMLTNVTRNLLQETNQTGNVKSVNRIHGGNGLIITIAWSGKSKRSHTMWVFEFYTAFIEKCVMPALCCYELGSPTKVSPNGLEYGRASYMR